MKINDFFIYDGNDVHSEAARHGGPGSGMEKESRVAPDRPGMKSKKRSSMASTEEFLEHLDRELTKLYSEAALPSGKQQRQQLPPSRRTTAPKRSSVIASWIEELGDLK